MAIPGVARLDVALPSSVDMEVLNLAIFGSLALRPGPLIRKSPGRSMLVSMELKDCVWGMIHRGIKYSRRCEVEQHLLRNRPSKTLRCSSP